MTLRRLSMHAAAVALVVLWGCTAGDPAVSPPDTPPPTSLPPGDQTGPAPGPNAVAYTSGEPTTGYAARIDMARTGFNDQQLVVSFTGGPPAAPGDTENWCAIDYAAEVGSLPDRVVVRLHGLDRRVERPPNSACAAVGYGRLLAVTLPEPLNGRPVFDGSEAPDATQPRLVINGDPLATARYMPEGWILQSEGFSDRFWSQTYAVGPAEPWREDRPSPVPVVHTVQMYVAAGNDPIPNLATTGYLGQGGLSDIVASPTVHGLPAELRVQDGNLGRTTFVIWQEGDYWFGVSAVPGVDLASDELLRIAESMAPYSGSGPPAFPTTTASQ